LSTKKYVEALPDELEIEYEAQRGEENEVQVTISTKHSLNKLFEILTKNNIEILSFRNKQNRLEVLFIDITK